MVEIREEPMFSIWYTHYVERVDHVKGPDRAMSKIENFIKNVWKLCFFEGNQQFVDKH